MKSDELIHGLKTTSFKGRIIEFSLPTLSKILTNVELITVYMDLHEWGTHGKKE